METRPRKLDLTLNISSEEPNFDFCSDSGNNYSLKNSSQIFPLNRKISFLESTILNISNELNKFVLEENPKIVIIHGEFSKELTEKLLEKYSDLSIFYSENTIEDIGIGKLQKSLKQLTYFIQIDNEVIHYYN